MENTEIPASQGKRKRHRQIVSCKSCKNKRVKCEEETDSDIINSLNYSVNDDQKQACKRCISKNIQCEYFEKIAPPPKKPSNKRPYNRRKPLSDKKTSTLTTNIVDQNIEPLDTPGKSLSNIYESQLTTEYQHNQIVPNYINSIKQTMSFTPFNSNVTLDNKSTVNNLTPNGLPGISNIHHNTTNLAGSGNNMATFSPDSHPNGIALSNKAKNNNPLKDLADIVADDVKNNGLTPNFGYNKPITAKMNNYTSPNIGPMMANLTVSYMNQGFLPKNNQQQGNLALSSIANKNTGIFGNMRTAPFIAGSPNTTNNLPRLNNLQLTNSMYAEKKYSPIEINHILKPQASLSPDFSENILQKNKGGFMQSPRPAENAIHPLKNMTPGSNVPTAMIGLEHIKSLDIPKISPSVSFKEKYYNTPLNDETLVENPIRKLDMNSVHDESVFTCSAISVRPWFEESKLVQKHKVLFDHLREKSHEKRNKQNDYGIGNIKKDRKLLLNSYNHEENNRNIWDRIVAILPPMNELRECIKAFFNSNLHNHVRVVDRVSILNTLEKYFEVEKSDIPNEEQEADEDGLVIANKKNDEIIKKIKLNQTDNFFNVAIVLQIYRIVMGKNITESEDDLFRLMEIYLNGLSSGFIWSFTKLQFSILCYLQRHIDLTMSDFGFNFKVISEHIASTCLKVGLNKGVHNYVSKDCNLPEWTIKNLYMWSLYFDLMHALEAGCALIIPYDPIVEAVELNDSERGRDGLLRRFIFLGRKIINAFYEPYGVPDFDGMLSKIKEFENLEFIPLNNYCNISMIDNIDMFDYSVLEPLMDLKLTIHMLKHLTSDRSLQNIDFAYFFGFTFSSLAITIVMREKWQNSLQPKELIIHGIDNKVTKKIDLNHLSYFHSLSVQRDLIDKIGITFYGMLYRYRELEAFMNLRSVEEQSIYSHDDILSHMISLVLLDERLPLDLEYNAKDLLKCFTSIVERFYNVDMFGDDKQPHIHFREFETIFRNIYSCSLNNLEAVITPKPASVIGDVPTEVEGTVNENVNNQESVGAIWYNKYNQMVLDSNAEEIDNSMQQIWTEEDVNALQLFDVDFTTFLTPFL